MYVVVEQLETINSLTWGTIPNVQAWEMWLSPHLEKPVGSEVG